ncbi:MAG: hypothetical protein P8Z75_12940 [Gammaproteobacteria bacterium]
MLQQPCVLDFRGDNPDPGDMPGRGDGQFQYDLALQGRVAAQGSGIQAENTALVFLKNKFNFIIGASMSFAATATTAACASLLCGQATGDGCRAPTLQVTGTGGTTQTAGINPATAFIGLGRNDCRGVVTVSGRVFPVSCAVSDRFVVLDG